MLSEATWSAITVATIASVPATITACVALRAARRNERTVDKHRLITDDNLRVLRMGLAKSAARLETLTERKVTK